MDQLRRMLLVVTVAAVAMLGAACSQQDSTDPDTATDPSASSSPTAEPTAEPTASDLPACDEVWVAKADLPQGYQGCSTPDGDVEPEIVECSSGQRVVLYDDQFWALRGHVIGYAPKGLSQSRKYKKMLYACRA